MPVQWLSEYCDSALPVRELGDRLAMTGTEVERVVRHGVDELDFFVVGRVLERSQHPDADRLSVCRVDVGGGEVAQIVCGAPNVAAGQTVAVARPGAVMPDGTRLGAAKLRGVVSEGMILAEDEMGIGTDHAGIVVLDTAPLPEGVVGLVPGTPLAGVLPLATDVLELEITPNRPDCLAIYGVAREVHAATGAPLAPPPWSDDPGSPGEVAGVEVRVEVPELCPRFTARVFEEVKIGPSPPWLKARLMAAGQRPISNVVDITNYVMLLTGQPLHAFDLDRVAGAALVVRRARDGERMTTLDDVERELDSEMVVIDDAEGPTSIAGVMGGLRSEVSDLTTRVLMEAATWIGPNIHRTSLSLGLRSEASGRFEKQLQPEQATEAQAVATQLMIELAGARLVPGTIDIGGPGPEPPVIRLRDARVKGLLGLEIARERSAELLRALEFEVSDAEDGLDVWPPAFRRDDVTREADVIEEVARLHGLEHLPATLPSHTSVGHLPGEQKLRRRAEDALADRGLFEIAGWSFTDPGISDRLRLPADDPRRRMLALENPMSEDQSHMRTTLLGSLLDALRHNAARGSAEVSLFESGPVYLVRDGEPLPAEPHRLGALLAGPASPPTWRAPEPPGADFFAARGVLAGVLDTLRVPWTVEAATEPFLHPGRAAAVLVAGERVGWLGEVHPLVARAWDVEPPAGFEIDLAPVAAAADAVPVFRDVTSFPAVLQDIAIVVSDGVPAARVVAVVRAAGGDELERVEVFDVYRGEQVGEGHVSLALRLEFRAPDRTLTDAEAAQRREAIAAALADELGATLRG